MLTKYIFSNPRLIASFGISLLFVMILVYVPVISNTFGFNSLSLIDWIIPISAALIYVVFREIWKKMVLKFESRETTTAMTEETNNENEAVSEELQKIEPIMQTQNV